MKILLQFGGLLHFAVLSASALVPRVLDWRRSLAPLHPFLRQLFWVYGIFIVLVVSGFGTVTLANSERLASGDPLGRSFCALVAGFWLLRLIVQLAVFDCSDFLTNRWLKLGYHSLTLAFVCLTCIYGWTALVGKAVLL